MHGLKAIFSGFQMFFLLCIGTAGKKGKLISVYLSENTETKTHILDEAIQLDVRHCVSALQLAIDSYDTELVKLIVENLPENNSDLSKIYISEEFVTPLQYAIRKYDLLMQYLAMYGNELSSLNYKEVHKRRIVTKGILPIDKRFYEQQNFLSKFTKSHPLEECGTILSSIPKDGNIVCQEQKNMFEIITYLAEKTNPISVDNFYYLSDIKYENNENCSGDVLDLARILLKTGHADLSGTDFEWYKNPVNPEMTILTKLIHERNFSMLDLILTEFPYSLKDIINKSVIRIGDLDGKDFRYETDIHMFVLDQIESTKAWRDPNYCERVKFQREERRDFYGKGIAAELSHFLPLFKKAGADFTIKDQAGRSVKDLLMEWKDKFPEGSIPDGIL